MMIVIQRSSRRESFRGRLLDVVLVQKTEVIQAFTMANSSDATCTLGELLNQKTYYEQALQIDPTNFKAKAQLLQCEGKVDEAIEVLKVNTSHPDANVLLYYMTSERTIEPSEEKIAYII